MHTNTLEFITPIEFEQLQDRTWQAQAPDIPRLITGVAATRLWAARDLALKWIALMEAGGTQTNERSIKVLPSFGRPRDLWLLFTVEKTDRETVLSVCLAQSETKLLKGSD